MYAHASAGATDQSIGPNSPGTPRGTTAELGSQSQGEIGIGQMEFKVWSLGGRAEQDTSDVLIRRAVARNRRLGAGRCGCSRVPIPTGSLVWRPFSSVSSFTVFLLSAAKRNAHTSVFPNYHSSIAVNISTLLPSLVFSPSPLSSPFVSSFLSFGLVASSLSVGARRSWYPTFRVSRRKYI